MRAWPRVIHFRNEDIDLVDLALHNVEILFVKSDLFAFLLYSYILTDMITKKINVFR